MECIKELRRKNLDDKDTKGFSNNNESFKEKILAQMKQATEERERAIKEAEELEEQDRLEATAKEEREMARLKEEERKEEERYQRDLEKVRQQEEARLTEIREREAKIERAEADKLARAASRVEAASDSTEKERDKSHKQAFNNSTDVGNNQGVRTKQADSQKTDADSRQRQEAQRLASEEAERQNKEQEENKKQEEGRRKQAEKEAHRKEISTDDIEEAGDFDSLRKSLMSRFTDPNLPEEDEAIEEAVSDVSPDYEEDEKVGFLSHFTGLKKRLSSSEDTDQDEDDYDDSTDEYYEEAEIDYESNPDEEYEEKPSIFTRLKSSFARKDDYEDDSDENQDQEDVSEFPEIELASEDLSDEDSAKSKGSVAESRGTRYKVDKGDPKEADTNNHSETENEEENRGTRYKNTAGQKNISDKKNDLPDLTELELPAPSETSNTADSSQDVNSELDEDILSTPSRSSRPKEDKKNSEKKDKSAKLPIVDKPKRERTNQESSNKPTRYSRSEDTKSILKSTNKYMLDEDLFTEFLAETTKNSKGKTSAKERALSSYNENKTAVLNKKELAKALNEAEKETSDENKQSADESKQSTVSNIRTLPKKEEDSADKEVTSDDLYNELTDHLDKDNLSREIKGDSMEELLLSATDRFMPSRNKNEDDDDFDFTSKLPSYSRSGKNNVEKLPSRHTSKKGKQELTSDSGDGGGQEPPKESKKSKEPKKPKNIAGRIIGSIALILLLSLVLGGFFGYRYVNAAVKPFNAADTSTKVIEIPAGSSSKQIASILKDNGIIKNSTVFQYYTKFKNYSDFKNGYYNFSPSMDLDEISKALQEGGTQEPQEPSLGKVTIPEGYTLTQISKTITQNSASKNKSATPFKSADFMKVVQDSSFIDKMKKNYPDLMASLPDKADVKYQLEGYLFPATYDYSEDTTTEDMVEDMIASMNTTLTPYYDTIKSKGLSVNEVLSLAALVEKEGANDEDRRNIAQVFYNRIDADMPLQSNIAILYAEGKAGQKTSLAEDASIDTDIDSPYNLYKNTGYGPGPVANPGASAIKAVVEPKDNDYLYFVADVTTGKVYYSKTLEEHDKNVEKYINDKLEQ